MGENVYGRESILIWVYLGIFLKNINKFSLMYHLLIAIYFNHKIYSMIVNIYKY